MSYHISKDLLCKQNIYEYMVAYPGPWGVNSMLQ